eukprot:TRINITY_DN2799_c0_g4_i2.p1 TRINITY_DN2799_c0_g4~~TRINITY_DN2799_c0_g4_i2.p1  ORF type:complete len:124 (+),score=24.40 TRINITY_DN2799_c0_g4_i2:232-603(+)
MLTNCRRVLKEEYKGDHTSRKETYKAYYSLGAIYMQLGGRVESAYKSMTQALQVANAVYGKNSIESAAAYLAIGKIYKGEGDVCNALNHFRVAEEILSVKGDCEMRNEVMKELEILGAIFIDK